MTDWTLQHTASTVQQLLIEAEVPVSRVNTIADIFEDQHFRLVKCCSVFLTPILGEVTMPGVVPKMSRTPGMIVKAGSNIGEDTRDVLTRDLNLSDAEVDRLIEMGAVWCSQASIGSEPLATPGSCTAKLGAATLCSARCLSPIAELSRRAYCDPSSP